MTQTPRPPTPLDLVTGRTDWRLELLREYQTVAARLQTAYTRILIPLRSRAQALAREMGTLEAAENLTAAGVRGLRGYNELIARIEAEMDDFAVLARSEAANAQNGAVQLGLGFAEDAVMAQTRGLAAGVWMRPDPVMLERLIGYADSEAMRTALRGFGHNAAMNFADALLSMTAQGAGSRRIARAMAGWLNLPYSWALNTVSTTQNYAYRAASHAAYAANERVVEGWMWRAALDTRTCMSCIAQHGSIHPVTETLNDHHQGRCAPVPVVRGSTWAQGVESGRDWYGRLPEGVQRQIAGDLMFVSLRQGAVQWDDLSVAYTNDIFGTMLREASVEQLVESRRTYVDLQAVARGLPANATTPEQAARLAAEARAS